MLDNGKGQVFLVKCPGNCKPIKDIPIIGMVSKIFPICSAAMVQSSISEEKGGIM